jgi:hypothetical protein
MKGLKSFRNKQVRLGSVDLIVKYKNTHFVRQFYFILLVVLLRRQPFVFH